MIGRQRIAISVMLIGTFIVTMVRTVRAPNDFAVAHWLLDYRLGFTKRAFLGSLVTLATRGRPSERLIDGLACAVFAVFCLMAFTLCLQILRRSNWSNDAVLTMLVFLSSPFIVMSAQLIGYFDNIIFMMAVASILLIFRGRVWWAGLLQAIAMLIHENALLIGLPVVGFAWWLVNEQRVSRGERRLSLLPMLLPLIPFAALLIQQIFFFPPDYEQSLVRHLLSHDFFSPRYAGLFGRVLKPPTFNYDRLNEPFIVERLTSGFMYGIVVPSTFTILGFTVDSFRIRILSKKSIALIALCVLPQLIHVVAWDTARIWTYAIGIAFIAMWVLAQLAPLESRVSSSQRLLGLAAVAVNIIVLTPLFDDQTDRLENVGLRLLLYAPTMIAAIAMTLRRDDNG
jgi:hypothetical protein